MREDIKTLTLDQVKAAGRFAWLPNSSWLWIPSVGVVMMDFCEAWLNKVAWFGGAEVIDNPHPHTGWRHLPGCDCEFCKEG